MNISKIKDTLVRGFVAFAACAMASSASAAGNYNLPAGEKDTISTNVNYTTMNIAGDLTISGGAKVNYATTLAGSATVSGTTTYWGNSDSKPPHTLTLTNNVGGSCGKIVVTDGGTSRVSGHYNVNIRTLYIRPDASVAGDNGYLDVVELNPGSIEVYAGYNYSTLTARVTVAQSSTWAKINGFSSGVGSFRAGRWLLDLKNGSTLTYEIGNQQAGFNDAGVFVQTAGTGHMKFSGTASDYPISVRKGAYFNHAGEIQLAGTPQLQFEAGAENAIGPNVTRIKATSGTPRLQAGAGATANVPCDIQLSATSASLAGYGTVNLDCSQKALSFTGRSGAYATLAKTGSYEATVESTYLSHVHVREGVMRFKTRDCQLLDVRVEDGAELVADGVTLTLTKAGGIVRPRIRTENGGKVVFSCDDPQFLYGGAFEGRVQVAKGDVDFGAVGCTDKYWRMVFKGMKKTPTGLRLRNIYMFDGDHQLVNWGLGSSANVTDDSTEALAAGKIRFRYNAATNLTATSSTWYQQPNYTWCYTEASENDNHYPRLKTPVLNPDDPVSHLTVEMRLADAANPVTGYNMCFVTENGNYPNQWDVYSSPDGTAGSWQLVDTQANVTVAGTASDKTRYLTTEGLWYANSIQKKTAAQIADTVSEFWLFGNYLSGGLSASAPIQLGVDAGASIALTNFTAVAQTIDALVIDAAVGGGTVYGGALAAKGRIELANYDLFAGAPIALELDGTAGTANLPDWEVYVDGLSYPGCRLRYDAAAKQLIVMDAKYAYVHVTETSAGDLQSAYPGTNLVVEIDANVNFTNNVALTGSDRIILTGLGCFVLPQKSPDYTGTITVRNGRLDGRYDNAFGTGTVEIERCNDGVCLVVLGSTTQDTSYDNDFVVKPMAGYEKAANLSFYMLTSKQKAITLNGDITGYGDVNIDDDGNADSQNSNLVTFNGTVTVESYTVSYGCDNQVKWTNKIVCDTFKAVAGYPTMGRHYLYSSQNRIGKINFRYIKLQAAGAEAFGGAVITFDPTGDKGEERGSLALAGYDQHVACLTGVQNTSEKRYINYSSNAVGTLTLTGGVERAQTNVRLGSYTDGKIYGRFALTVDAGNDDFVQEFTNTIVYTSGDITVKNGTLLFTGTSSMRYTKNLNVEGGCLDLDVTAVNACSNVTQVTVGSNAVLRIGTSAATPFVDGAKAQMTLDKYATLELPEGAAATVNKLFVGSKELSAGVYTGAEGAGGDAKVLPQIRGAGRLTVLDGRRCGLVILVR